MCSGCGREKWGAVQLNADDFPKASKDGLGPLCLKCGTLLDFRTAINGMHPLCAPSTFSEPPGPKPMNEFDDALRRDLSEFITAADASSDRSMQVQIGPSELGDPCDRKMAYKLASTRAVNIRVDNWPAIVGTAIHEWLAREFDKIQKSIGAERFLIENTVHPTAEDIGHSDIYDLWTKTVLDWKTLSERTMKKLREDGPPDSYKIQVNLYGLGQERAGHQVERVGIVGLPRSGWLASMYVWTAPYDRDMALAALARRDTIKEGLAAGVAPQSFEAVPSRLCSWCPFFRQGREGADRRGCPGR